MKNKKLAASTARKKHLKIQHHKMNTRRQFYFNQVLQQEPENQQKGS